MAAAGMATAAAQTGDDGGNCGAVNVATGDRIEVDGNKTEHPYRTRKTAPGKRSRTVGSR
jgi:hypothetical protein